MTATVAFFLSPKWSQTNINESSMRTRKIAKFENRKNHKFSIEFPLTLGGILSHNILPVIFYNLIPENLLTDIWTCFYRDSKPEDFSANIFPSRNLLNYRKQFIKLALERKCKNTFQFLFSFLIIWEGKRYTLSKVTGEWEVERNKQSVAINVNKYF